MMLINVSFLEKRELLINASPLYHIRENLKWVLVGMITPNDLYFGNFNACDVRFVYFKGSNTKHIDACYGCVDHR